MSANHIEVQNILQFLLNHLNSYEINQNKSQLNSKDIMMGLYGLQKMSIFQSNIIDALLQNLLKKLENSDCVLDNYHIAMYDFIKNR